MPWHRDPSGATAPVATAERPRPRDDVLEAVGTALVAMACAVVWWGGGRFQIATLGMVVLLMIGERVVPDRPQSLLRRTLFTDVQHFALTSFFGGIIAGVAVVALGGTLQHVLSVPLAGFHRQPWWAAAVEALLMADLLTYATHRGLHASPFFWRFHALHHSSREVDWLSAYRSHPVDTAILSVALTLPLYVTNMTKPLIAVLVLGGFEVLWVHSNTRWHAGRFGRVINNPEFHRWHHANEPEAINKNFATWLSLWDRIFGTLYMPADRRPEAFGIDQPIPDDYLGQLLVPFRRHRAGSIPSGGKINDGPNGGTARPSTAALDGNGG